jgi:hypothetical protein
MSNQKRNQKGNIMDSNDTPKENELAQMKLCEVLEQFRREWPAVFAGTELTNMTGKAYQWRTLQNEKCLGKVPEDVFIRSGSRKLLVVRDKFLPHWQSKMRQK